MSSEMTTHTADYRQWLGELKTRFRQVQLKAAVAVNTAMLQFYWELGADMVAKQTQFAWGSGFLTQLSADLNKEFPNVAGFSKRNLEQIRRWHSFWSQAPLIAQQPASQLMGIPWWHHVVILSQCKQHDEALYYVQATQTFGWSRSVLVHQIESGLWQREGKAITNFVQTLPAVQSDLAAQMLKDPYTFDFLSLSKEHTEREFAGKLNFYIKAVDEQLRGDIQKPMGQSTYTLSHTLPEALRDKLPSIEAIERELGLDGLNANSAQDGDDEV
jgi:predicted nuclease of restriction endonuclease-like (RecB) superfamily